MKWFGTFFIYTALAGATSIKYFYYITNKKQKEFLK